MFRDSQRFEDSMTNELKVASIHLPLRYTLIGLLFGALVLTDTSWSATVSASTNSAGITEKGTSDSKSGNEQTTQKPQNEASTQWGFFGSLATAFASIV